jgi:hypothetical protein
MSPVELIRSARGQEQNDVAVMTNSPGTDTSWGAGMDRVGMFDPARERLYRMNRTTMEPGLVLPDAVADVLSTATDADNELGAAKAERWAAEADVIAARDRDVDEVVRAAVDGVEVHPSHEADARRRVADADLAAAVALVRAVDADNALATIIPRYAIEIREATQRVVDDQRARGRQLLDEVRAVTDEVASAETALGAFERVHVAPLIPEDAEIDARPAVPPPGWRPNQEHGLQVRQLLSLGRQVPPPPSLDIPRRWLDELPLSTAWTPGCTAAERAIAEADDTTAVPADEVDLVDDGPPQGRKRGRRSPLAGVDV